MDRNVQCPELSVVYCSSSESWTKCIMPKQCIDHNIPPHTIEEKAIMIYPKYAIPQWSVRICLEFVGLGVMLLMPLMGAN